MVLTLASTSQIPRIAMKPDEAAEATGFSRTRIFSAIRDGELTARKDGKATVIEISELQRWLRSLPTRGRSADAAGVAVFGHSLAIRRLRRRLLSSNAR